MKFRANSDSIWRKISTFDSAKAGNGITTKVIY